MERLKFEEFFIIFYDIFFDNVNDKISSDFFNNINIKNKYWDLSDIYKKTNL